MDLPARDRSSRLVHVLVDTPKGSPVKFKYDFEKGCYTITHVLPPGTVFPFDFGSIPRARRSSSRRPTAFGKGP
jgi:inorganic pyrophosphatase